MVTDIGANAKMNEFAAIMGLCNLNHIDYIIRERQLRNKEYKKSLRNITGIQLLEQELEVERNYGYFPIVVNKEYRYSRDELYELLKKNNYFTRKYFYPLTSDQVCFKNKYVKSELKNARELSKRVLVLPLYETLDIEKQRSILDIIKKK